MFTDFSKAVQARYNQMAKGELFTVASGDLFETYLAAFPPGTNPLYKTRTVHDCQCCKQFVIRLGRVVAFVDNKLATIWDVDVPEPFKTVADKMNKHVLSRPITGVFRTSEKKYGIAYNYGPDDTRHDHFEGIIAAGHYTLTPEKAIGDENGTFQVLQRGLAEIKIEHLDEVLALIAENGLYRGGETKAVIEGFRLLAKNYKFATEYGMDSRNFVWQNLKSPFARFRSSAIGQLFVELAEGKPFEQAIAAYEKMVAPENYKRTSAPITTKMVENAVQKLTDLGLHGAMQRRYAKFTDVSVADVLFVDNSVKMKDGITELLATSVKTSAPDLSKATRIKAEDFIKDVLPGKKKVSLFLENRHQGNFVSITGGDGPERMFKWDNNFGWSYDGDVTDSVKQRVKAAGGKIDCLLRVSLSWYNYDDLDLHCEAPSYGHIYFGQKQNVLDVDMNAHGPKSRNAVENLAFNRLPDGVYKVYVNQYQQRESDDVGFAIELEYKGVIHQYSYPKRVVGNVPCFDFTIKKGELTIDAKLEGGNVGKEKWGVKTESLVPVQAIMYSPNHWGTNNVGAKHTIFALKDCVNPDPTRGIYNEYLRNDLIEHRKVFEILAGKTKCPPTSEQISGVGFSAARGDSVTVLVDNRPYLLEF